MAQRLEGHSGAVSLGLASSRSPVALVQGATTTAATQLLMASSPLLTDFSLLLSPLLGTLSFHPLVASVFSWLLLTHGLSLLLLF